jgi:hypothetical protein
VVVITLVGLLGFLPSVLAASEAALWQAVRSGGTVVLPRHAIAPGTGDPAAFDLGDCSTQRNLSDEGRAQAKRIRALLRANGVDSAQVYSSQWCRCLETARLLGLGPVKELPALNSFFGRDEQREVKIRTMRAWIARQTLDAPVILVTHQVNVTGITDVYPASGEMVVVHRTGDGRLTTLGTIATD